jgi:hypothetical protein
MLCVIEFPYLYGYGYIYIYIPVGKWPNHEADHLLPCNAEVENEWWLIFMPALCDV